MDTSTRLGNTSPALVQSVTHATHTSQLQERPQHALPSAMMDHPRLDTDTSASQTPLLTQEQLLILRLNSLPTAQLKEVSKYTKTSTHTRAESTNTPLDNTSEVTPSRFSDTELNQESTISSVPTHGEPHGEKRDTSRSSKETVESTTKSTLAPQTPQAPISE